MNNSAFSKIWILIILIGFIVGGILVWQWRKETSLVISDLRLTLPKNYQIKNISDSRVSIVVSQDNISVTISVVKDKDLLDFGSGRSNPRKITNGTVYDLITISYICRWGLELKDNGNFYFFEIEADFSNNPGFTEKQWGDNCDNLVKNVIQSASISSGKVKEEKGGP